MYSSTWLWEENRQQQWNFYKNILPTSSEDMDSSTRMYIDQSAYGLLLHSALSKKDNNFRAICRKCQEFAKWKNLGQKFTFQRCQMWTDLKWHDIATLQEDLKLPGLSFNISTCYLYIISPLWCFSPPTFSALQLPRLTWERLKVFWLQQIYSELPSTGWF